MSTTPEPSATPADESQDNTNIDVGIVEILAFEMYANAAAYDPDAAPADSHTQRSNWRGDRELRKHWRARAKQVLASAAVAGVAVSANRRKLLAACQDLLVIPATPAYTLGED